MSASGRKSLDMEVEELAVLKEAVALLDQGRAAEARERLAQLLAQPEAPRDAEPETPDADVLSDSELEEAFTRAETDTDQLITPNRVAEEALARVDGGGPDALGEEVVATSLEPGSEFATATMAALLEQQGDESGAERIRAALDPETAIEPQPRPAEMSPRAVQIATLTRWLENIRGDRA